MNSVLRELATSAISLIIIGSSAYESVFRGINNPVLLGLSGVVMSFYFTRQAVSSGHEGITKSHADIAQVALTAERLKDQDRQAIKDLPEVIVPK